MCSFFPLFVPLFVCYPRFIQFALASFYADCPHKLIIYNESVHGREEHSTLINSIPLKIATLLSLQTLKWVYTFGTDVLIVSATSRHYSVLFGHDHFGTECRSKRQFGSLIRYYLFRLKLSSSTRDSEWTNA